MNNPWIRSCYTIVLSGALLIAGAAFGPTPADEPTALWVQGDDDEQGDVSVFRWTVANRGFLGVHSGPPDTVQYEGVDLARFQYFPCQGKQKVSGKILTGGPEINWIFYGSSLRHAQGPQLILQGRAELRYA